MLLRGLRKCLCSCGSVSTQSCHGVLATPSPKVSLTSWVYSYAIKLHSSLPNVSPNLRQKKQGLSTTMSVATQRSWIIPNRRKIMMFLHFSPMSVWLSSTWAPWSFASCMGIFDSLSRTDRPGRVHLESLFWVVLVFKTFWQYTQTGPSPRAISTGFALLFKKASLEICDQWFWCLWTESRAFHW